jgi:hypothetical protein
MTSNINPNNIDGAYPVAGQDNNSQGFRDNFTNTSTNFQFAADEITDLQNNAVLKSALVGTTLNNNMQGSVLSNAQLQDMSETVVSLGTVSGTTTINYALGSYQTLTTNGAVSLAFSNFSAAGTASTVVVQVTVAQLIHTLTLPAAVRVNVVGTTQNPGILGAVLNYQSGSLVSTTISFAATGTYSFIFTTTNGGTTITVTETNQQLQPFNNSSEDLGDTAAASLALTTSYFSTVTNTTATLAAGVNGQIKTFVMYEQSGNMVITVTNAGWGGSGTITFNATGQGCILQYINSKWFCIGNNGATFA